MKKCFLLFLLTILLLASCVSTKVKIKKYNLADTNITFNNHTFNNFKSAFKALHPEEAYNLAETEAQKTAAKALKYVIQNKYEEAAETFMKVMRYKDSLDILWKTFPYRYYNFINYNWKKLEEYENIREGITDSSFAFYKNKSKFQIDFLKDSVIVPIKLANNVPLIKIKINNKYYSFLIDTGVDKTTIGKNIATKNNVVYDNKKIDVRAIDGNLTVFSAILSELDLEQIKILNLPIEVINRNDAIKIKFLFITFFQCDGIIGWDVLSKFDFTIDYKNKQLVLRKPIKKNIVQKNLFWYRIPIINFSCSDYSLLAFLDTGSGLTYFYQQPTLSKIFEIDTNNLKKKNIKMTSGANKSIKKQYYKYPNFQCYTIANNEVTYFNANEILLGNEWDMMYLPLNVDAILGSNWFKDKIVRVDMLNGIFEIKE